jgi:SAM-dependent methyltransferase
MSSVSTKYSNSANNNDPSSDLQWTNWASRLYVFQEWRKEKHSPLVRAWWSYLTSVFFDEIKLLNINRGLCLDVGCGSGTYLSRIVEDHDFGVGLDPLKSSLKACKDELKRADIYYKVDLILAVGEFLPLKKECVQLSIMTGSLDHVNEPTMVIDEFYRVLLYGGNLMLAETALIAKHESFYDETHVNQFTQIYLKSLLGRFRITKVLKKIPIFSQIRVPDQLIDCAFFYAILSKVPGLIGNYFNYSEVLFECEKNYSEPFFKLK